MNEIPTFDELDESEELPPDAARSSLATESIDLDGMVNERLSSSGTFQLSTVEGTAFGKLLDALPILGVLIDLQGDVMFVNEALRKLLIDYSQLIGRPFVSLLPSALAASVNQSHIEKVFETRKPRMSEAMLQIDQSKMWGRFHLRCIRIGHQRLVLNLIEDLTHEKRKMLLNKLHQDQLRQARNELARRNEQLKKEIREHKVTTNALRESQAQYRTIVEGFDGLIYICSENRDIEFVNRRLTELAGRGPVGEKCYEALFAQTDVCPWCQSGYVMRGHTVRLEVLNPKDSRWYYVVGTPLHHPDGSISHLAMLQDITDRKKAEEAMLQTERLKAVGELATGVAHNFNNLLQIVTGRAFSVLTDIESGDLAEARKKLEQIIDSSRFGAGTVKQLQEFARVRSDQAPETDKVFDLSQTVQKAVDMSQPWWKTRPEKEGIQIALTCRLTEGCFVDAREAEIFQVMINLIKNAAEALPQGGDILITTDRIGDKVALVVADNGVSIPVENLGKVFEPFWTTKGFHSSGMGLASSLGIVKRFHGAISVESTAAEGTRFTVTLPLAQVSSASAELHAARDPIPGLQVLVIDDMEPVVAMLGDGLSELGLRVLTAYSGREGIELFMANSVDVVVCDLAMPEMNGWQVGEALRAWNEGLGIAKAPFILLTGWGGQVCEEKNPQESGVDIVLEKPVDLRQLFEQIQKLAGDMAHRSA